MSHTYAILELSKQAVDEIRKGFKEAGYQHAFHDDVIDMHGVAVRENRTIDQTALQSLRDDLNRRTCQGCDRVAEDLDLTMRCDECRGKIGLPPARAFHDQRMWRLRPDPVLDAEAEAERSHAMKLGWTGDNWLSCGCGLLGTCPKAYCTGHRLAGVTARVA